MAEQATQSPRRYPRLRALKAARLHCGPNASFDVTIRDLSEGGVRIKLGAPFVVPEQFKLLILNPNTGITNERTCARRWQHLDQIGAEFIESSPEPEGSGVPGARAGLRRRPIGP